MTIVAAADGSALGNPGPAGWAWYVDDARWHAGGWPHGTNNQGELMAVIDLLESTATAPDDVHVLCDSQYVINAVTKWMPGWKRKGWRKADGSPVLNRELVQRLDVALAGRRVSFEWVKGHAGHAMNEAADQRARAVATAYQRGDDVPAGPGWRPAGTRDAATEAHSATTEAPDATVEALLEVPLFDDPVAASDDAEAPEAAVTRLEQRLLDPAVRADASEVAALLHPEFEEIGSSGRLWDRDTVIQSFADAPAESTTFESLNAAPVGPDAVLITYRTSSPAGDRLRSSLWLRRDGKWRLRFHQGTPVEDA
ncbi:MAG TPA: ribonuclease HI family protein [Humibacter sp.]|nr:ribonuclease HI family protein [Humibacter sp.]